MNNHIFLFMNDGILWMDISHFVLIGSLPIDLHLFLPFLVHLYPSYTSIQWPLTAVLELFIDRDFDPALTGCSCAASKSTSPISHPTAELPEPFPCWHCPFPLLSGSHNPPWDQRNSNTSPLPSHCSGPSLNPADRATCRQHSWCTRYKGSTTEALLTFQQSSNERFSKGCRFKNQRH